MLTGALITRSPTASAGSTLFWLAAIFAVAVILLGRWRGPRRPRRSRREHLHLVLEFVVPSMLQGNSPVIVAIVGSSAIAFVALYCAGGFSTMTTVVLLATLGAARHHGRLATAFTELAQFSGAVNPTRLLVKLGSSSIDLRGLVLAGMVLGALGALDDVTVTQASTVAELRANNEREHAASLTTRGSESDADHVVSTVDTLALAYAGAALPILILFSISGRSLGAVANGEIIATEIVSALVGSIGPSSAPCPSPPRSRPSSPPAHANDEHHRGRARNPPRTGTGRSRPRAQRPRHVLDDPVACVRCAERLERLKLEPLGAAPPVPLTVRPRLLAISVA